MRLDFLGQPLEDYGGVGWDWLTANLADDKIVQLWIATAWAKRSALEPLASHLEAFRKRAGTTRALIGIDEGGATKQGLELALTLLDEVHIYHIRGRVTFHPKMYLAVGEASAELLVGSNNLTAGGLFTNYESALSVHLDRSEEPDRALLETVLSWFDQLTGDDEVSKHLTPEFLEKLLEDPSYKIGDEDTPRRDSDSLNRDSVAKLFGLSKLRKRRAFRSRLRVQRRAVEEQIPGLDVLVQYVPSGSGRSSQPGISESIIRNYFGLIDTGNIVLRNLKSDGTFDDVETRPLVFSQTNRNRRVELSGLRGVNVSDTHRPIMIFRKQADGTFDYLVLEPAVAGYVEVASLLPPVVPRRIMPSRQLTTAQVRQAWSAFPL